MLYKKLDDGWRDRREGGRKTRPWRMSKFMFIKFTHAVTDLPTLTLCCFNPKLLPVGSIPSIS